MKVKSKKTGDIYNANISGTGWHIWIIGYNKYCSDELFKKLYTILL